MTPPDASRPEANDPGGADFGNLAVLLGILTVEQRDRIFALQAEFEKSGIVKRFGELCVERKLLNRQQVLLILQAQGKRILTCGGCRKSYNIHGYTSQEIYYCKECGSTLEIPNKPPAPKVSDSIMITQTELRTTRRAAPLPISPELARLFPEYELAKQVGQGGMGTVFKAKEKGSGRSVAIKVLAPFLSSDEKYVSRFFREAKNLQKLDHPNIVACFGAGAAGEYKYLVMEYVRGATLSRVLKKKGKLRELQALKIVRDVALGLAYAWGHQIIHRDVKPHNIMISEDNAVKLCDLGLSKELGADISMSSTSNLQCTPAYASPEQLLGQNCDGRTDTYSLGVTLYQMLAGKLPFEGANITQFLHGHLQQAMPDPRAKNPEISADAVKLIQRMMEKDRDRRPEPGEVAKVLSRHLSKFQES